MKSPSRFIPLRIERQEDGLWIEWAAGHRALYPSRSLRLACPCAVCVEEMTGRPLLDPGAIPDSIQPMQIRLVGNYGLRVTWNDGHDTGIFTFQALAGLCPCDQCRLAQS